VYNYLEQSLSEKYGLPTYKDKSEMKWVVMWKTDTVIIELNFLNLDTLKYVVIAYKTISQSDVGL